MKLITLLLVILSFGGCTSSKKGKYTEKDISQYNYQYGTCKDLLVPKRFFFIFLKKCMLHSFRK